MSRPTLLATPSSTQLSGLPPALLPTLLDHLPSGVVYYQPVRDAVGIVVDFRFAYLNALAQHLWQLPAQPLTTYLGQEPASGATRLFEWHRVAFLTAAATESEPAYQEDGRGGYWQLRASQVEGGLLVSFTPAARLPDEPAVGVHIAELTAQLEAQQFLLPQILGQVPAAIATMAGPDHRFTYCNARYQTLAAGRVVLGQPAAAQLPEATAQGFIALLDQVYTTGEPYVGHAIPLEQVQPSGPPRRCYLDFTYQPLTDGHGQRHGVLCFAVDVTAQVLAQQAREAKLTFLTDLADKLARLATPDDIISTVGEQLGQALHLDLCLCAEVAEARDGAPDQYAWQRQGELGRPQQFRSDDFLTEEFGRSQRAGETFVVRDTLTDERADADACIRLSVGSLLAVPFHRHGQWVAYFLVTAAAPRDWQAEEIALVQETAERVFPRLERARADKLLAQLLSKYQLLYSTMDQGFGIAQVLPATDQVPVDVRWLEVNPAFERLTGVPAAQTLHHTVRELNIDVEEEWFTAYARATQTRQPTQFELYSHRTQGWLEVTAFPLQEPGQVGVLFRDSTARRQAQQRQQVAAVLEGQEEERRRIAESLHNGIGQILYATKLQLDLLPPRPAEPARQRAAELLAEAIRQTRAVSHELTPAILLDFGLTRALQEICRQLGSTGLRWHCYVDLEEAPVLPLALQQAVYRLVQGVAHNVAHHAQATEATLEVSALPGWLVARLEDDGRGFDPATVTEGLGLQTLRSRVVLLGGIVQIASVPGQGSQISFRLPLV